MESPNRSTDFISVAQVDQTEEFIGVDVPESVCELVSSAIPHVADIQNDVRETISAPSEMIGSSSVRVPILTRNNQINSASPTAKKLNQRSNGKPLPPLTKNAKLSKH